jgi:hypothetical protein
MTKNVRSIPGHWAIQEDIWTIVGGHFSPDSLSPEVYDAVLGRLEERPGEYISVFEEMFLGLPFDAERWSRFYLASFLELAAQREPRRAGLAASRLLKQYDAVMIVPDELGGPNKVSDLVSEETMRTLQRIQVQRAELKALAAGGPQETTGNG